MDIFRNIENDTFGYGGITAKQSKYQERLQLMICPDYSTVQLLYLWDKKVCLSITNENKTK